MQKILLMCSEISEGLNSKSFGSNIFPLVESNVQSILGKSFLIHNLFLIPSRIFFLPFLPDDCGVIGWREGERMRARYAPPRPAALPLLAGHHASSAPFSGGRLLTAPSRGKGSEHSVFHKIYLRLILSITLLTFFATSYHSRST